MKEEKGENMIHKERRRKCRGEEGEERMYGNSRFFSPCWSRAMHLHLTSTSLGETSLLLYQTVCMYVPPISCYYQGCLSLCVVVSCMCHSMQQSCFNRVCSIIMIRDQRLPLCLQRCSRTRELSHISRQIENTSCTYYKKYYKNVCVLVRASRDGGGPLYLICMWS